MNRGGLYILLFLLAGLSQCKVYKEIVSHEQETPGGIAGLSMTCEAADTIRSIGISKADAVISADGERYEAQVTLYALKDSLIYMSAVNSGFEILRASVDSDSIRVIDRINKVVYSTPLRKRFGYQHPVNFNDLQHLVSRYFVCDKLEMASEPGGSLIEFDFDEPQIRKRVILDRESFRMTMFEYHHTKTHKYIMGEDSADGFKIYSNFMISDFEVVARGGELTFNQEVEVRMAVNPRRYSFINL